MCISPKQEIYRELYRLGIVYIRNRQSMPFWRRWGDRSVYEEAELIHNLWPSLFDPEFGEHDLWFLNYSAHHYCEKAEVSELYANRVALIRQLFALIPEGLRSKLMWSGP